MKLSKFRSAIVYRATLPSIEAVEGHLLELPYSDIGETEFSRASFVPNPVTGELVTPLTGGYAIVIRHDQKILPAQVVVRETQERVNKVELLRGEKVKRIERRQIAAQVKVDLCKKAFVKSSLILALYKSADNLLVINTSNKNMASLACALLIKVIGSVKTETIHISDIKNGLTTRLQNHLAGNSEAFDGFAVGDYIQLSRHADQKETIRYSAEHNSVAAEIIESLNSGFTVDQMELVGAGVHFLLTENFHFRRIDTQDHTFNPEDDRAYQWRHQAGADLFQFSKVVNGLCELLSYKDPQDQKPAA
ncbi:recombination-associated protein RdgC [Enterobacter sp. ENT03]|uniref:recombination-associated protein RdgC n=1 Tax=Enterobacter sp. ENT03 TaxID=2854780 RepID=UPI001C43BFE4|nr:recombination-associated protein RdgC [Enterobacter sp. ENT03]MBV7404506.1 recombination-associated protein RdgC [Enterobacter sp. ENT03]